MRELVGRVAVICGISVAIFLPTAVSGNQSVKLPPPSYKGNVSVEAAMRSMKSVRNFSGAPLSLQQISQILWAANGRLPTDAVSGATTKVTPSAGGLYPLEIFVLTGKGSVESLPEGIYLYKPETNSLSLVESGDKRNLLAYASLSQMWMTRAPATIVIAGAFGRTTSRYGDRGVQYVFMEAGNSNQNIYLQAAAMRLGAGTVGAFNDAQVAAVLKLPGDVKPLLLVPVGK
ncbi:MAG: SagB/ThcOx family dehydrogenase [Desulfomonilaceae bacterium]|nr:SagB/ThcOx family dehydrogenase [Desulfomonilaceae bacterium]